MLHNDLKKIFPGIPEQSLIKAPPLLPFYKRTIDSSLISTIENFISISLQKDYASLGLNKTIVGLSGGVDSVICAVLLKQVLKERSFVVIVDFETEDEDLEFSVKVAEKIGIKYQLIKAPMVLKEHLQILQSNSVLSQIHLRSRLINNIIFQVADNQSAITIDTTDKSEKILSIYAESFRGHLAPLIDLYKSELYDLADYFGLSELRQKRSGCPNLLDIDAFGIDWEVLDPILYLFTEEKATSEEIAKKYGIDIVWLQNLERRIFEQPVRTVTKQLILGKSVIK